MVQSWHDDDPAVPTAPPVLDALDEASRALDELSRVPIESLSRAETLTMLQEMERLRQELRWLELRLVWEAAGRRLPRPVQALGPGPFEGV